MKILTIDMNCIFYSCIKLYADKVNQKENATVIWNILEQEFGMEKFLTYDSKLLLQLANILHRNSKVIEPDIYVVEEQSEIVDIIKNQTLDSGDDIKLYNIDFFDDFNFIGQSKTNITRFDKYDSTNWIGYLLDKKIIYTVTWYKPANSVKINYIEKDISYYFVEPFSELYNPDNEDFDFVDVIIISYSPKYVPYKYRHLVDLLKMIGE